MYITEVSIKRPVVAWVMSLILIIFGIFVFLELPVRELPDGNSLTGNFQNTNKPNKTKISDITQDTTGLLILISVINIYFLIGLIFPFGFTFLRPSATIR